MKKIISLISFIILIVLSSCIKHEFTCKITYPYDGITVLTDKDLQVTIDAQDNKNSIELVKLYFDVFLFHSVSAINNKITIPLIVTIPSHLLTLGNHTIKAVVTNSEGAETESSITVHVVESIDNKEESPDFVTFTDGKFPVGWKTYTWEPIKGIGYDDDYSLKSANYPIALVYAYKTMDTTSYVEFYTKGDVGELYCDLYIDDEKAEALSCTPDGSWNKWVYLFEKGRHEFKWEANGALIYLDAVKFALVE